jgi:hypothetical protein
MQASRICEFVFDIRAMNECSIYLLQRFERSVPMDRGTEWSRELGRAQSLYCPWKHMIIATRSVREYSFNNCQGISVLRQGSARIDLTTERFFQHQHDLNDFNTHFQRIEKCDSLIARRPSSSTM